MIQQENPPTLLGCLRHVVRWHDQLTSEDLARFRAAIAQAVEGGATGLPSGSFPLWIATADRPATEADCVNGKVLAWNGTYVQAATPDLAARYSHWMPQPEAPMSLDDTAFASFLTSVKCDSRYPGLEMMKGAWDAAIAHCRS